MLGGKAFLEHLQEPEPLPGQVCSTFTLYLHFRNQRFRSKPVPCACEPDLKEGFLLEIHRDGIGKCKLAPMVSGMANTSNAVAPCGMDMVSNEFVIFSFTLTTQERAVKWRMRPACFLCVTRFNWCWSGRTPPVRRRWSRPTSWTGGRSSAHPVGRPAWLWSWWELVRKSDSAAVSARVMVFSKLLIYLFFIKVRSIWLRVKNDECSVSIE